LEGTARGLVYTFPFEIKETIVCLEEWNLALKAGGKKTSHLFLDKG
jgi:hypothetical protein